MRKSCVCHPSVAIRTFTHAEIAPMSKLAGQGVNAGLQLRLMFRMQNKLLGDMPASTVKAEAAKDSVAILQDLAQTPDERLL